MRAAVQLTESSPALWVKPDYTLPLRMQAAGRRPKDREGSRVKRLLWVRALRDRFVWKQAFRPACGIGACQMLLMRTIPGHHLWLAMLMPFLTLMAAIGSSAATCVKSQLTLLKHSMN